MDMAEAFSELNIDDIDNNDFDNPQLCAEYVKEIYKYIREQEVTSKVTLSKQNCVFILS